MDNSELLDAVKKRIDYEAYGLKMWYNECLREGLTHSQTRTIYQSEYNCLVNLREKMSLEYLEQVKGWIGPEAVNPIYNESINEN